MMIVAVFLTTQIKNFFDNNFLCQLYTLTAPAAKRVVYIASKLTTMLLSRVKHLISISKLSKLCFFGTKAS